MPHREKEIRCPKRSPMYRPCLGSKPTRLRRGLHTILLRARDSQYFCARSCIRQAALLPKLTSQEMTMLNELDGTASLKLMRDPLGFRTAVPAGNLVPTRT